MVFQDYALFPHMTVIQNVVFGLREWPRDGGAVQGIDERPLSERAAGCPCHILALMDEPSADGSNTWRRPLPSRQLSGGEQQFRRVALSSLPARSIAPFMSEAPGPALGKVVMFRGMHYLYSFRCLQGLWCKPGPAAKARAGPDPLRAEVGRT